MTEGKHPDDVPPIGEIVESAEQVVDHHDDPARHQEAEQYRLRYEIDELIKKRDDLTALLQSGEGTAETRTELDRVQRMLLDAQADEIDVRDNPSGNPPPSV